MKKERPDMETFAAGIADKQDNPTIYELAKEFPEKTYTELETYRDLDRHEEANKVPLTEAQRNLVEHIEAGTCIMGEMRKDREKPKTESQKKQEELEPIEGEEQDNPTLWELAKEHNVSYADAVPIQEDRRLKKEAKIEAAKIKKDVTEMDKLKKRAQEAEGELSIMKQLETNRVKEAQARCNILQDELDRVKRENNDLFNRVADSLEVNESHQRLNGKLQVRIAELEDETKKMHDHLNKQMESARKAGL